jgi:hypothetical protein
LLVGSVARVAALLQNWPHVAHEIDVDRERERSLMASHNRDQNGAEDSFHDRSIKSHCACMLPIGDQVDCHGAAGGISISDPAQQAIVGRVNCA